MKHKRQSDTLFNSRANFDADFQHQRYWVLVQSLQENEPLVPNTNCFTIIDQFQIDLLITL